MTSPHRSHRAAPLSLGGGGLELLGIAPLEEHARRLAALLSLSRGRNGNPRAHLRRLSQDARVLREVYTALAADARREADSPAAEWLLDNFHLITATIRDIRHDLPPSFVRQLPLIATDDFAGIPRIHALALELVRCSAGSLDGQRLQRFITSFQSLTPLTIGELWALPSALKLVLIEYLRERADILAERRKQRRLADELARTLETERGTKRSLPADVHPAFVIRLLQRSREYGATAEALRLELDAVLAAKGRTVEDAIRSEGRHQASEQVTMANLIGSLRLIGTFDWSEFFESVSLVEQVLRRDPAGVYDDMDFRSRDRYRHAIEELAEPNGDDQLRIALKSVERARQVAAKTPDGRGAHIGYHLIGSGRRAFEQSVAWRPRVGERLRRFFFHYATIGYLGTIAMGTAVLVGGAVAYAAANGWSGLALALVALLTLVPASELTIQIVQRAISYVIPPRRLPRLELDAVPASGRTIVVVPTMFSSAEGVAAFLDHLEVQALGNVDPHIHFAVLSDFRDAPHETMPEDAAIVEAARRGIEALNRTHAESNVRFYLFHRRRQWNESESRWMGWERKRGKLEEFNRLLRGATDTSFSVQVGDLTVLSAVRYCITLDTDTRLPRDAARELIGIITHPLNRASFDPKTGRVVEGYGILQPRVSVTFTSAAGSLFARLYSGHTGVDPYTTAVSDTYQDLFGEGIFTGKGLYDVDAFIAALHEAVPENTLLSHDLFEGVHARVALVSDVELVDEYPASVLAHARRQHRWIRGDWQILFWLFPFAPSRGGWQRNTLPLISRWKILDNLRRSLVTPALLALAIAGWSILPAPRWFWTTIVTTVLAAQLLPLAARLLIGPGRSQSQQRAIGLDIINEGELTKGGDWLAFMDQRLGGFEERPAPASGTIIGKGKDREEFADFYRYAAERQSLFFMPDKRMSTARRYLTCTSPIAYTGQAALERELSMFRAVVSNPAGCFLTSTAPSSLEPYRSNEFYDTPEEFVVALAEALRVEYEAIVNAGFLLQIDDAWLVALWDRIGIAMGLEAFKRHCLVRIDALNHALRHIDSERVRYHLCWGSWHGPHAHDLPLADIVDVMLQVKARFYSFEAANVRHEHEWTIWERVKLLAGKAILPGVVTHSTDLVEHPELVSQRIQRFARLVGAENVIASTDCGFGGRTHPQIAWAKLRSLCEGASLASSAL